MSVVMKKQWFIPIFVGTHILFVFLIVHKNSNIIKQTYRKQHQEKIKEQLVQKKQQLTHQLYLAQHRSNARKFAVEKLHMTDVKIDQIKKLQSHA